MERIQNWEVAKPAVRSAGGLVASQSLRAAAAGAEVLRRGGNAIDAAVATGFALNACEPWMSGLGGGGYMLVWLAAEKRVRVVDFSMHAPAGLDPADYPLAGESDGDGNGDSEAGGLFPWPPVLENRNNTGHSAIAVPGNVDGLGLALERFGTMPLADVMAPAIALADAGLPVDWWVTLNVATTAADLALFPASRAVWLPGGLPPVTPAGAPPRRLEFGNLAATLRRIAEGGRRAFYEGELARSIATEAAAGGSALSVDDLASYHARELDPLVVDYRGVTLHLAPGLTGGPTMARALRRLGDTVAQGPGPGAGHFVAYAEALLDAYRHRLATMGAGGEGGSSCTSHVTAVDRDGNMVALTQTLLARFGSKVVLPGTGILMNNGIAWFDPVPGRPNSLAPGRRPLSNMCPLIASRDDAAWFSLGASGGRRIVPAVTQLTSLLIDCGLSIEEAFHRPRIDVSGPDRLTYDPRLDADIVAALARVAPAEPGELAAYPALYACPNGVARNEDGGFAAANDIMSPQSGAVAAA